ncbi:hypothetical protein M1N10_04870 [Thermodesulfovibrionales bacterium]|nr:hypothetical protein [Thermodesulfovibrionales bacterium]
MEIGHYHFGITFEAIRFIDKASGTYGSFSLEMGKSLFTGQSYLVVVEIMARVVLNLKRIKRKVR